MKIYKVASNGVWDEYSEDVQKWVGEVMGIGKYASPRGKSLELCDRCGKQSVYSKEMHPDSDVNYMARICEYCGEL